MHINLYIPEINAFENWLLQEKHVCIDLHSKKFIMIWWEWCY